MVSIKQEVLKIIDFTAAPSGQKRSFLLWNVHNNRIMVITKHFAYADNLYITNIPPVNV